MRQRAQFALLNNDFRQHCSSGSDSARLRAACMMLRCRCLSIVQSEIAISWCGEVFAILSLDLFVEIPSGKSKVSDIKKRTKIKANTDKIKYGNGKTTETRSQRRQSRVEIIGFMAVWMKGTRLEDGGASQALDPSAHGYK
ncbi:hypothetical protein Tco_0896059 [Tanacetum coccineum]